MQATSIPARLKRSLAASAGTVVFGMEDGTVSIFGLIFGVAATTSSSVIVLIAGASGAAAAAVSMMAGAYLDAETSRDGREAKRAQMRAELTMAPAEISAMLSHRLAEAGLTARSSAALSSAVLHDPEALSGLLVALQATPEDAPGPFEQALWMLFADFLSAAIPIVPFILLPISEARIVSAAVTIALLVTLGIGRALIGKRSIARTVAETVCVGIVAALAGIGIGLFFSRNFGA